MTSVHSDHTSAPTPLVLPANQPRQFYRGGEQIAALRGQDASADFGPEDWVASTTTRFGQTSSGLSRLPDGRLLREAIANAPRDWLGTRHTAVFGESTALLVKLLDAGQRLPVHCHPDDAFARAHLGSRFGKTEAWVVVGTTGPNPVVHLGFRRDVDRATIDHWVSTQDSSAMLGALNEIPVRPGDTVHVPAGVPHAIGRGVFIVELQQPTDFSITLEWQGFLSDAETAFLGMTHADALDTLNRDGLPEQRLAELITRTADRDAPVVELLSAEASAFFRAERLHAGTGLELEPSFGVLVALDGAGTLRDETGHELPVRRGDTVVIPHSAGAAVLAGELTAVHARPPAV